MKRKFKLLLAVLLLYFGIIENGFAVPLNELFILAEDGQYLGNFTSKYSEDSIYNQYGTYGSKYNSNSIFNSYGTYGSDYSDYSPFDKYSSNGPWLVDGQGNYYGRLSINKYASGVTDDSYNLACQLKGMQDSM